MAMKVITSLPIASAEEILAKAGIQLVQAPLWTEKAVIEYGADADAAIVGANEPYTPKAIQALSKCKILSRTGDRNHLHNGHARHPGHRRPDR